jgi:hypothetical protein
MYEHEALRLRTRVHWRCLPHAFAFASCVDARSVRARQALIAEEEIAVDAATAQAFRDAVEVVAYPYEQDEPINMFCGPFDGHFCACCPRGRTCFLARDRLLLDASCTGTTSTCV